MYSILLAEDEDIIRKGLLFSIDWTELNCKIVAEASNGKEAIEKIQINNPDIVIADINMPFINGIDVIKETKEIYNYDAIILTGYSEFQWAKQCISLGVSEYLLKPLNHNELIFAISKIINKRMEKENIKKEKDIINREKKKYAILDTDINYKNKTVNYMLERIRSSYNTRLSITDISMECNKSCTHLNTKFKEATGYTFNDYLNRYRILIAIDHLKKQDYLIYEIAEKVGYSDYKYFINVFKKYTGTTPTNFIEQK